MRRAVETEQHAQAGSRLFDVLRHVERGEFWFLAGMIFERLPVEGHALVFFTFVAFYFFIETALGLVAEPLAFEHLAEKRGDLQLAAFVFDILRHVRNHMPEDIEADEVDGAEGGRARPAHGLSGERVDFFDGQVHLLHQSHHVEYGKCADAVCDEVGSVFCQHDALAELCVAKVGNGFDQRGVGIGRGDEFKQAHVARRIEEVGAKPGAAEVGRKSLGDFCHGKPAGVGGDDGAGLADGLHFL